MQCASQHGSTAPSTIAIPFGRSSRHRAGTSGSIDRVGRGSSGLRFWRGSSRTDAGTTSRPSQRTRPTGTRSTEEPRSGDRRRTGRFRVATMVDLGSVRRLRQRTRASRSQPRQRQFWPGSRRVARRHSDRPADERGARLPSRVPQPPARQRERGRGRVLRSGGRAKAAHGGTPDPTGSGCAP
jgi:hypothetical protein